MYRARDTRLNRDVALKILPATFTHDPERVARFRREAQVLASLNHPHIAAIYGLDEAGGMQFLVLELVDGRTIAQRIAGKPLPFGEALGIARQIAEALDAAHEKGIVHRDLKPANVALTLDGQVKVLDFGLAKAGGAGQAGEDLTHSPTITVHGTRDGVILGTAAYMSPEQARGQAVDKRTDVWAFGCVLYEMLTGRAAFGGNTVSDTIAKILEREPDWAALPSATPMNVRRTLQRCLEKDPKCRLRDIGDARFELDDASTQPATSGVSPSASARHRPREYLGWAAAALLLIALGAAVLRVRDAGNAPAVLPVARTAIVLPADQKLASAIGGYPLAVSPDGARLAYVGEQDSGTQLYVRELSALEPKVLPGTTGATHPFFSPDGQWVGFFAAGALQKVAVAGGAPLRICNVPGVIAGASWGPDNTIVLASRASGLSRIHATGGTPQPLPGSSPAAWPEILPNGKTVLFTTGAGGNNSAIAMMSLDGGARRIVARMTDSPLEGPAVLGTGGDLAQARFVPTGYLVYGQSPGIVRAVPFDLASQTVKGSPISLVDSVERARNSGAVYFAMSKTGLLVYASTGDRHQLVWVDRHGTATPIGTDRQAFRIPRLSPDGTRIAVAINDETRRSDIWIYDAERGTKNRLTTEHHNLAPVWTPDGTKITFNGGGIAELRANGSGRPEILCPPRPTRYPTSWSPDGQHLLFHVDDSNGQDLGVFSRADHVPRPLLVRTANDHHAQFSPDGRWVAFESDESGRDEIYVGPYPDLERRISVSTDGGAYPQWSRDGELFYRQGDALMSVTVNTKEGFRAEKPERLFSGPYNGTGRDASFDVAPDGRRFVMVKSDDASTLRQLTVVQNLFEELKPR